MYIDLLIKRLKEEALMIDKEITPLKVAGNVLNDLNNEIISRKAKKYFRDKHNLILDKYNIDQMKQVINGDLFILRENLKNRILDNEKINELIYALSYYQLVSSSLLDYLKGFLAKTNMTNEDIIRTLESIKLRNTNIVKRNSSEKVITSSDLFLIVNMLSSGYEEIDVPENSNKDLDLLVKNIIIFITEGDINELKKAFKLEERLEDNELKFIYSSILKYLQDEIYRLIQVLKIKEFYFDINILQEIKNDYKSLYYKYMIIRDNLEAVNERMLNASGTSQEELSEEVYTLLYTTNYIDDVRKCYFMKDFMDLREESLEKTFNLLRDFRFGKTSRIKHISYGYIELKDDQIRIILKPLKNKEYVVIGVFIKKAQNDMDSYNKMFQRPIIMLNYEYSREVDSLMENYMRENARKGTR